MATIVQLMDTLGLNRGGLTKAVFKRMNLFVQAGYDVWVCVTEFQPDAVEVFKELQAQGLVHKSINIHCLISNDSRTGEGGQDSGLNRELSDWTGHSYSAIENSSGRKFIRHYDKCGRFLGLEAFGKNGVKVSEDHHAVNSPFAITHRVFFDGAKQIRKVQYFDSDWRARFETAFGEDGAPVYSSWLSSEGKKYRITHFSSHRELSRQYSSWNDFRAALLEKWLETFDVEVVVMSDEPMTIPIITLSQKLEHVSGIGVIHNTHFIGSGTEPEMRFKGWVWQYSPGKGLLERVVCVTNSQLVDVRALVPALNELNSTAIPHSITPDMVRSDVQPRAFSYRVLFLGRLAPQKRVHSIVRGFAEAAKELPELTLDIVGDGPDRDELISLTKELRIQDKVIFHGHSSEPLRWYDSSDVMLMNSEYEAFGLTLLEAFSRACPVISSPTKYGPLELVKDGFNGIVFDGTAEGLGRAIVDFYSDESNFFKNRINALSTAYEHPDEKYAEAWLSLLKEVAPTM